MIREPAAMAAWSEVAIRRGERIAFVPTMGFLHDGHLSLLREGRRRGDRLVLSIFVNPTQFSADEAVAGYPRDLRGDLEKAAATGTDAVYLPDDSVMYPPGYQTFIRVRELEQGLCGTSRPDHFQGVATVVCKLFNVVRPTVALFGEKDYQQLAVIRRMVKDLDIPVQVQGLPTVREPDGLAMSSRNSHLSAGERQRAVALSRGLFRARALYQSGERGTAALVAAVTEVVMPAATHVEYVELRDADTLAPVGERIERPAVMVLAAIVGTTRLIDNLRLE